VVENANALKGFHGLSLKLYEVDYWSGTVLNVAHGMIPICTEFLHVLLLRPVGSRSLTKFKLISSQCFTAYSHVLQWIGMWLSVCHFQLSAHPAQEQLTHAPEGGKRGGHYLSGLLCGCNHSVCCAGSGEPENKRARGPS
jgi:hypothetical protein